MTIGSHDGNPNDALKHRGHNVIGDEKSKDYAKLQGFSNNNESRKHSDSTLSNNDYFNNASSCSNRNTISIPGGSNSINSIHINDDFDLDLINNKTSKKSTVSNVNINTINHCIQNGLSSTKAIDNCSSNNDNNNNANLINPTLFSISESNLHNNGKNKNEINQKQKITSKNKESKRDKLNWSKNDTNNGKSSGNDRNLNISSKDECGTFTQDEIKLIRAKFRQLKADIERVKQSADDTHTLFKQILSSKGV